jgi:hypothetical protein
VASERSGAGTSVEVFSRAGVRGHDNYWRAAERLEWMKYKLVTTLLVVAGLVVTTFSAVTTTVRPAKAADLINVEACADGSQQSPLPAPPCPNDDVILRWNEQLLASIRANPARTGPTVTARALGVLNTAIYDAWAAYNPIAKATQPNGNAEQPVNPDPAVDKANKSKAISFAAYKVLVDLFPSREGSFFGPQMTALGYNNSDTSPEATVGNTAAAAVLTFRHGDGSNQTTDTKGTPQLTDDTVSYPYNCTPTPTKTCYTPTRHWNEPTDPWKWQPLCVPLGTTCATATSGGPPEQAPLTPQWGDVKSFASSPAQYKVTGPPRNPDGTCCSNADVVRALNDTSNLDDRKKVTAEYWADGPGSVFPPGHTALFAQALSRKNQFTLDTDVKMFFALGNAEMDASIGAWATKYKYNFWRPITAIRYLYKDQTVTSWRGPGADPSFGPVLGKDWRPYQLPGVVTPAFPEYVSGHSTFTAAGGIILSAFTTSDIFGGTITFQPGWATIEPGVPAGPVTLTWPTFTAAADEAGMSRRYGGIHFYSGDMHGRMLGNLLGRGAYSKAQSYIQGKIGN